MQRTWFGILITAMAITGLPAKADLVEDCEQQHDLDLAVSSCTTLIETVSTPVEI